MANDVEIRVKTTGASDAGSKLDGVSSSIRRVGKASSDETAKLDKLGETGGTVETRFLGLGAGISGVSTLMSGDAGPEDYAMAIADLGDSIEHTVIPALKNLSRATLTNIADTVKAGVAHAATAVKVVAGWVLMGIQATLNAMKMAAAWLISLGPIGLVILAIGAVIAILVALGVGFDDLKRWAGAAWKFVKDGATSAKNWIGDRVEDIVGFFTGLPGRISSAASGMWNGITSAFKSAINGVIDIWNGISFTFGGFNPPGPGSIPGFTISTPYIGHVATGGVRTGLRMVGERGRELVDMGAAGGSVRSNADTERLLAGGGGGGGNLTIIVQGSVISERQLVQIIRDEATRGGFRGAF